MTRPVLALLLVTTTVGCRAWRPEPLSPQALFETRHPAVVRATTGDGRSVTIHHPRIVRDSLQGSSPNPGEPALSIPLCEIQLLETRYVDGARTATLFLLGIPSIYLLTIFYVAGQSS